MNLPPPFPKIWLRTDVADHSQEANVQVSWWCKALQNGVSLSAGEGMRSAHQPLRQKSSRHVAENEGVLVIVIAYDVKIKYAA